MTTPRPTPARRSAAPRRLRIHVSRGALVPLGFVLSATFGCDDPPTLAESEGRAPSECTPHVTAHAEARLLTRSEYRRSVQDLLHTKLDPTGNFPPEPVVAGFENDASSHQANPLLVEKHAEAAALLAADLLSRGISEVFACPEDQADSDCASAFIENVGRRAYRRPLTPGEHRSFSLLYERAAPNFGHEEALATIVEAALQSPQFLYRVEAPVSEASGPVVPLGPYEMASRLSYFLWGTTPDDELLKAAAENALASPEQVETQARRLLQSTRAKDRAREFHSQWLGLSRFNSIARDDAPGGAPAAFRESTLRYIDRILWSDTPTARELFSSSRYYYDKTLAPLYGQETPDGWASTSNAEERHGLLTQPGMMALFAHADQTSPIQRGVFVRESILCEEVEPPPPSVDNNPPDPDPNLTTRERFAVHTENRACATCHRLIDPLGFGFENYDHLGRFRSEENGLTIDTSGEIVEVAENSLEGPFSGPEEMADRLAESQTILSCLARKWFTFAMGRTHNEADRCSIDEAVEVAASDDGNLQELLIALTKSSSFRTRPRHEADVEKETP